MTRIQGSLIQTKRLFTLYALIICFSFCTTELWAHPVFSGIAITAEVETESFSSVERISNWSDSISESDIHRDMFKLTGPELLSVAFAKFSEGHIDKALMYYLGAVENDDSLLEINDGGLLDQAVLFLRARVEKGGLSSDSLLLARVLAVRGNVDESLVILQDIADSGLRNHVSSEARRRLVALRFMSTL